MEVELVLLCNLPICIDINDLVVHCKQRSKKKMVYRGSELVHSFAFSCSIYLSLARGCSDLVVRWQNGLSFSSILFVVFFLVYVTWAALALLIPRAAEGGIILQMYSFLSYNLHELFHPPNVCCYRL